MDTAPYDLVVPGLVHGTRCLAIFEKRAWDASVRNETRLRVEACLRLISERRMKEAPRMKEIMVQFLSPADTETTAFFDSLRTLTDKQGITFTALETPFFFRVRKAKTR